MATINPSSLYNSNDAIFDAKPYIWHYDQLKAHQDAKDAATEDFYRALPNTINDKGLRDIDVPGVNEARNAISQNFIQNKNQILKGNTPESYNYQKQIRDLQGKVQEGLNASKDDYKIAAARLDPNKAYMFQGDDKFKQIASHNLSVFDPNRKGVDFTNFTAAPKTWGDTEDKARRDYMNKYKPSGFDDVTYDPMEKDSTKMWVTQHPRFEDNQIEQMKIKSLYDYADNPTYKNKVDRMIADPVQKSILEQQYKHFTGETPTTANQYATAFDMGMLNAPGESRKAITNGEAKFNMANAAKIQSAKVKQVNSQANIAANKNDVPINNAWTGIDKVNTDSRNKGQAFAQVNLNDNSGQKVLVDAAKSSEKNTPHDNSTIKTRKEDDGRIGIYGADDSRFITYLNQQDANTLVKQPDVKAKRKVAGQGNSNQQVPVQQKATPTKAPGKIR